MFERPRRSSMLKLFATALVALVVTTMSPVAANATTLGASSTSGARDAHRVRRNVKERARTQIGASYSYGGSAPRAFDCSGFTMWTFERLANLPHNSTDQFNLAQRRGYKRIWKRSRLKVGDLVFHHTTSSRVGHAGVYIGRGRFISSTTSEGVRVRSLYDSYWGPRWVGATRIPATQNR
jgi:cell wall-associated NlpC family hydrolase